MLQIFGILAGILSISGYFPYILDIFKKKARPQRASWLIWSVDTIIAFVSQFFRGATNSLWLPGLETCGLVVVFLLSLKFGVGGFTKKDIIALSLAGVGLVLWYFTKEPAVALYIIIAVDSIGTILTIQKAYEDPESETMSIWLIVALAGLFGMLAVGTWNVILLSYPLYIFVANAAIPVAMILGRKRKKRKS